MITFIDKNYTISECTGLILHWMYDETKSLGLYMISIGWWKNSVTSKPTHTRENRKWSAAFAFMSLCSVTMTAWVRVRVRVGESEGNIVIHLPIPWHSTSQFEKIGIISSCKRKIDSFWMRSLWDRHEHRI